MHFCSYLIAVVGNSNSSSQYTLHLDYDSNSINLTESVPIKKFIQINLFKYFKFELFELENIQSVRFHIDSFSIHISNPYPCCKSLSQLPSYFAPFT